MRKSTKEWPLGLFHSKKIRARMVLRTFADAKNVEFKLEINFHQKDTLSTHPLLKNPVSKYRN